MSSKSKIISLGTLKRKLRDLRKKKKTIGFTNGCFDLLHQGHVQYLEEAAKHCDALVLGLNSDSSIRRIKGPERPIVKEYARARVIAALEAVDFVILFDEDTPYNLIQAVQPDMLFKGADWKADEVVGADIVKARKGKVKLIDYVANNSSTNLIATVLKKCGK